MGSTRFEARDLKPYAEPVSPGDLQEGEIYFFVNYLDEDLLFPTLEPVVYIGKDLEIDDAGIVYFQDIISYQQGVRHDSISEEDDAAFYSWSENEINYVFEYERALDELMRCALRRRATQS